jgi:hypothetical protein
MLLLIVRAVTSPDGSSRMSFAGSWVERRNCFHPPMGRKLSRCGSARSGRHSSHIAGRPAPPTHPALSFENGSTASRHQSRTASFDAPPATSLRPRSEADNVRPTPSPAGRSGRTVARARRPSGMWQTGRPGQVRILVRISPGACLHWPEENATCICQGPVRPSGRAGRIIGTFLRNAGWTVRYHPAQPPLI